MNDGKEAKPPARANDSVLPNRWQRQFLAAAVCGGFGIAGAAANGSVAPLLYSFSYVAGAWFTAPKIIEELREKELGIDFLMVAVAAGAAATGNWGEGAVLLFLFSLSGAMEAFASHRTEREISALFKTAPKTTTILDPGGQERVIAVSDIVPGMTVVIRPGDQIPVDGDVFRGESATDESTLTGEAEPVSKGPGDQLFAGSMNLWGAMQMRVTRAASDSALERIIALIRHAQQQKAPAQKFTDRFGTRYTYAVLTLCLAMFLVWWLGFGFAPFDDQAGERSAFYRAMTLLVVLSPCALALSIPSAILAAIAWAARHGILFRGGHAVEKLAEITVVAMDKTGTLTTGELEVDVVESNPPGRENDVARIAFALDSTSTHPLARAIVRYGKRNGMEQVHPEKVRGFPGHGVEGVVDGQTCRVGRASWVTNSGTGTFAPAPAGRSEVYVAGANLLGRILLRDEIRRESAGLLQEIKRSNLRSLVLTGDKAFAAAILKSALEPDEIRAELTPEGKVGVIQALAAGGEKVAMIGDGVNDAPSLAAAHVGVAMGARGSDAALEQADVVLMHDRLENFIAAHRLSHRATRIIKQNLAISLASILLLAAGALASVVPLPLGVIGHEGSTVIVVLNSLRLLRGPKEKARRD